METKWYVTKVAPGKERILCDQFNCEINVGKLKNIIRFVCPTEPEIILIRNKKVTREKVIYPGYLYFETENKLNNDELKYIGSKPLIIGMLGNKIPILLNKLDAEKIIKDEALTKRQDEKKNILKPGAEVKISNGSFNGFEGVIDSINSDKAIIMVEIFDRPMKITVNINELTKK
jgi:transcription termination/antitermination protein NusG